MGLSFFPFHSYGISSGALSWRAWFLLTEATTLVWCETNMVSFGILISLMFLVSILFVWHQIVNIPKGLVDSYPSLWILININGFLKYFPKQTYATCALPVRATERVQLELIVLSTYKHLNLTSTS